jgi:hypothetical protein
VSACDHKENIMSRQKRMQVIPVSPHNSSWMSLADEVEAPERCGSPTTEAVNVNLIDYMTAEEFVQLMKMKTDNNYGSLWKASKALALQLKASKSILALNSYLVLGKSKNEVLDKLIGSMKYAINADHVYILEFSPECNNLQVSNSDNVSAIHQQIAINEGVEG